MSSSRHSHYSHGSRRSNRRFMWKLEIFSSRECNIENTASSAQGSTMRVRELHDGRGWLHSSPGVRVEDVDVRVDHHQFTNLAGRYRTVLEGFWVIFLDGMRWYYGSPVQMTEVTLGTGDNQYAPHFINGDGDDLGPHVTITGMVSTPVFSFIPRTMPALVYIKEDRDGLMAVRNGRMMMWIAGHPENPPLKYWNMLREHAETINTPGPKDIPADTQVPQSIRRIAQEIGAFF
ncbi:hypothetical protein F5Y05DRAFT_422733 [Hypoxylon sp. FL0543]|nr:hypothetical protein F5Y05DRAFT_422733 [Hypoxylon sp. FL0543]